MFGVLDLEVLVAALWGVESAVEIVDSVLVHIRGVYDFDGLVGNIEVFFIGDTGDAVFLLTITEFFKCAVVRDDLVHFFEADLG